MPYISEEQADTAFRSRLYKRLNSVITRDSEYIFQPLLRY
ncbi:hypothetical protein Riv7116_3135 [Rivularia sp. PCC 7116]|nr:hypothetical protein Riv7116_3135 [Rivularia sp. PCC 7116]